ncbi:MAG TPA: PaaI family thioesterase, partial [Caulobacteraceae bacterium]|nr:PaaI family thioesterase [Caulobacteraceae bacterium]
MAKWTIKMGADELNALMGVAFKGTEPGKGGVVHVEPGRIRVVQPFAEYMLRPGDLVAGPSLMGVADTAAYNLILAHVGPELMA